jgi:IS1 family transposase
MANILPTEKQIAVISALAEGSSIRSIERMTGIHRDTVMRLGVKVGQKCATILDNKMHNLPCNKLQLDEIWGFVGKKQRRVREVEESRKIGDAWTFCALDAETKIVPCFRVGKRDAETANAFLRDLSGRLSNRVQISTDGLRAYIEAVEQGFGADVDYAQIVKSYESDDGNQPERRYSPPRVVSIEKRLVVGNPDAKHVSTSYIERQNLTMRTHMRRLTRLTLGFSKKWENFEAAVALHFAYYNLCKIHKTLRCTPAMASGVEKSIWSVSDLVEATN